MSIGVEQRNDLGVQVGIGPARLSDNGGALVSGHLQGVVEHLLDFFPARRSHTNSGTSKEIHLFTHQILPEVVFLICFCW